MVTTIVTPGLAKSYFGLGMDSIVLERFIIKDNVTIGALMKGNDEELFLHILILSILSKFNVRQ